MTEQQRIRMLEPPTGCVDMVLDTDAFNEVDDQFAIAYLLRSEKLNPVGICAAPYMASSAKELYRNADTTVYTVKRTGKNAVQMWIVIGQVHTVLHRKNDLRLVALIKLHIVFTCDDFVIIF